MNSAEHFVRRWELLPLGDSVGPLITRAALPAEERNDLVSQEPGMGAGWMVQSGMISGGKGRLFKNGTQIAEFPHSYNTGLAKLVIGEEISKLGFMAMDVAALLIYNRALSDAERADVENYLHGTFLQLPLERVVKSQIESEFMPVPSVIGPVGLEGIAPRIDWPSDPSLRLQCEIRGGKIVVIIPPLPASGTFHLHHSEKLLDLADPGKRIHSFVGGRSGQVDEPPFPIMIELPMKSSRGFFQLYYEPGNN